MAADTSNGGSAGISSAAAPRAPKDGGSASPDPPTAFDAEVERALQLLGARPGDVAADALVDPNGAEQALEDLASGATDALLVRVARELNVGAAKGYTPAPLDPAWIRLRRGSSVVALAPLRANASSSLSTSSQVKRVALITDVSRCCDAPSCKLERTAASVWIELASEEKGPPARYLVAEARDLDPSKAIDRAKPVAALLARSIGAPLVINDAPVDPADLEAASKARSKPDPSAAQLPRLSASALARFALRSEGERIVLRDHASSGPRISARRTLLIGAILMVLAVGLWVQTARAYAYVNQGVAIAFGAVAALVSLTGYAFLGVGRFASRYIASSAPVIAFGVDRIIVAPWVSRQGAVDLRPEGRLGAAIPIAEVRAAYVRLDKGRPTIELETDHGPIDGLACDTKEAAEVYCEAIRRALDDVRHPKAGASARQRARAKAHA